MKYEIPNSYNVGVDVRDFSPVSLPEILGGYNEFTK